MAVVFFNITFSSGNDRFAAGVIANFLTSVVFIVDFCPLIRETSLSLVLFWLVGNVGFSVQFRRKALGNLFCAHSLGWNVHPLALFR